MSDPPATVPEPKRWRAALWGGETAPIPKVRAPSRSVYPHPHESSHERSIEIDHAAQIALRAGTLLLAGGAPTEDVEAAVFAVGGSLGLRRFEVDTTYTSIVISVAPDNDHPGHSDMRVVRSRSTHFARVAATHQLVLDLVEGKLSPDDVQQRLREIEKYRRPYRRWLVVLAFGVLSAAITVQLGGEALTALLAFVTACVSGYIGVFMATHKTPAFFINLALALMATLVAVGVTSADLKVKSALVVVGGIIALLPGMSLVVAAQEAIGSFSVTAAARIVELTVSTIGIVAGVLIGLMAADRLDVQMAVTVRSTDAEQLVAVSAAAIASIAAAVTYQSPRRVALTTGIVGGLGFAIQLMILSLLDSPGAATAIPAIVIGFASKLIGARLRVPTVLVTVPAIVPLLPGLAVYEGLLALSRGDEPIDGITTLIGAITVALALAGGVLLGQFIGGRPGRYVARLPNRRL